MMNGVAAPPAKVPGAPRFLVIGAGSRGCAYARAVTTATAGVVAAVAEPDDFKRKHFGTRYIWGPDNEPREGQAFKSWQVWLEWETSRRKIACSVRAGPHMVSSVQGVFICTLDETHAPIIAALAPLDLHIFCEKPLATSLIDCLTIYNSFTSRNTTQKPTKIFSIGHVLRYSPHNMLLRKLLLEDAIIGELLSVEHTEPVGWWHFSHSYVRGNWRRAGPEGVGSLLTKSCHDIDFIMWLLCSPPPLAAVSYPPHLPSKISSFGSLVHFKPSRKPALAGSATNCLSCTAAESCLYSAPAIYNARNLSKGVTEWPVKIVGPEIEDTLAAQGMPAAEEALMGHLAEDYDKSKVPDEEIAKRPWFGRCVFESDNNVCDDQTVIIKWEDDPLPSDDAAGMETRLRGRGAKTAIFHMIAPTEKQCVRRGRIYGTKGEVEYDGLQIRVFNFEGDRVTVHDVPKQREEEAKAHGGGDYGLTRQFVEAVEKVESGQMEAVEAQRAFVGSDLEEIVRSHVMVFAAEEARLSERVIDWKTWWKSRVEPLLG